MFVAQIALTIIIFILFAMIFVYIGYHVFNNIYHPKDKDIKNEKLMKENSDLVNINQQFQFNNHKIEEANKNNYQWYINQLYHIGTYLKLKHNDDYVLDQLNFLTGQKVIVNEPPKEEPKQQPIILDLDIILERILSVGYNGLTDEEKRFLDDESKKNISK